MNAQAGLEARQRRLVDELVLRDRPHPPVAVGDPVGLVDVGRLQRHAHAEDPVRRVGLEAELRVVDRQPAAGSAAPAPPGRARRRSRERRGDRDLARRLRRLGGRPRAAARVGVVGEAGDREALERRGSPCRLPSAPRRRLPPGVRQNSLRRNSTGGIGRRASEPLVRPIGAVSPSRTWSRPCPLAFSPAIAGQRELAVDDRRGGHQPAALALVLRRQPARLVGLVRAATSASRAAARRRPGSRPRRRRSSAPRARSRTRRRPSDPACRSPSCPSCSATPRPGSASRGRGQPQPARRRAAHEVVVAIPRRRRVGARVGGLEAARPPLARAARCATTARASARSRRPAP